MKQNPTATKIYIRLFHMPGRYSGLFATYLQRRQFEFLLFAVASAQEARFALCLNTVLKGGLRSVDEAGNRAPTIRQAQVDEPTIGREWHEDGAKDTPHTPGPGKFSQRLGSHTELLPGLVGNLVSTANSVATGRRPGQQTSPKLPRRLQQPQVAMRQGWLSANARRVEEEAVCSTGILRPWTDRLHPVSGLHRL